MATSLLWPFPDPTDNWPLVPCAPLPGLWRYSELSKKQWDVVSRNGVQRATYWGTNLRILSWVTWGKLFHLPVPRFHHLQNGDNNTYHMGLAWEMNEEKRLRMVPVISSQDDCVLLLLLGCVIVPGTDPAHWSLHPHHLQLWVAQSGQSHKFNAVSLNLNTSLSSFINDLINKWMHFSKDTGSSIFLQE